MYSPKAATYHYFHMARNNYKEYLKGPKVWLKKYLYVLRPCMCMQWLHTYGKAPPVNINDLINGLEFENDLYYDIHRLIATKKAEEEMSFGSKVQTITDYCRYWLEEYEIKDIAITSIRGDHERNLIDDAFRSVRLQHGQL